MNVSRDLEAPVEDQEVLLFCTVIGDTVAVLARRHWFNIVETDQSHTRRMGFQITWDGSELPAEWKPYAWAGLVAPDPAA